MFLFPVGQTITFPSSWAPQAVLDATVASVGAPTLAGVGVAVAIAVVLGLARLLRKFPKRAIGS